MLKRVEEKQQEAISGIESASNMPKWPGNLQG